MATQALLAALLAFATSAGAAVPSAPSKPVLGGSTSSSLTVNWSAPTGANPAVTDYDYRYRAAGAGEDFTAVLEPALAATSVTVDGLRGSTSYEVQVRASNADGSGPWSPSLTATTAKLPVLGPGLGNLAYTDAEVFKPLSFLDDMPPPPAGHHRPGLGVNVATILNGYFVTAFTPDGGWGPSGFDVYDVSDPRNILLVKRIYDPTGTTREIREAHSLPAARIDGSVYLAVQSEKGVEIWDFTDVNDIHRESKLALPGVDTGDYTQVAWQTAWQGRFLYVSSSGQGFFIVDVADPAAPTIAARGHRRPNPVPPVAYGGFPVFAIYAMGNHLVGTSRFNNDWTSLDIGNPVNPVLLDVFDFPPGHHNCFGRPDACTYYSTCFDGDRVYTARQGTGRQIAQSLADPASFAAVDGSLLGANDKLYCGTQDGHLFLGGVRVFDKVDVSTSNWRKVGSGRMEIPEPDHGQVTPMGNLVFVGNDHGTGSAFFPHDKSPDRTAPKVIQVSPRDGAANQPVKSRIGVAFSDPVQLRSLDTANVSLVDGAGTVVDGTYSADRGIVNFQPSAALKADTTYTVKVKANGVRDWAGNPTAVAFQSTFTTVADTLVEPVHRWPLAGDAQDWFDRNDGTAVGATFASGGGLDLDGSGDWVQLDQSLATLLKDNASVTFFLATSQTGAAAASSSPGIAGRVDAGGGSDAYWGWLDDTGRLRLSAGDGAGIRSPQPVNDGRVRHFVLTRDASTGRLTMYQDAVKVAEAVGPTGAKNGGGSYRRLGAIEGSTRTLHGTLQEVQVFNHALGATEVLQLYRKADSGVTRATLEARGSAGTATTFAAEAIGDATTTYQWDFGDGSSSAASNARTASHTYADPGHYTVQLTVTIGSLTLRYSFVRTVTHPRTTVQPTVSSTIVGAGDRVYKVNPDNSSVTAIHRQGLQKVWETDVGKGPKTVAVDAAGRVWAAVQGEDRLACLTSAGATCGTVATGRGSAPFGVAFLPGTNTGLATLQGSGEVLRFDAATAAVLSRQAVNAEPHGLAITGDGAHAYVTRLRSTAAGLVTRIDASTLASATAIAMAVDSTTVDAQNRARGRPNYLTQVAISPDGRTAWVPSKQDNVLRGQARDGKTLTHDSTVRAITSVIDLAAGSEQAARRIDFDDRAGAVAVAFSPLGDYVFVALQGSDSVAIVDAYSGDIKGAMERGTGTAPDGIWIDAAAERAFVSNFTSRSVEVYDIAPLLDSISFEPALVGETDTVASEALTATELRGLRIFYNARDPRMSRDGYLSCASCHLDGGEDGAVWDFTARGEGLRNTIALNGRRGTAFGRLHWTANFDEIHDFENDIRNRFGGSGLMTNADFQATEAPLGTRKAGRSADLDALAAYVSSLDDFGRSPHRTAAGELTSAAAAGETLFNELNCGSCHAGTFLTDGRRHDVGTIATNSGKGSNVALAGVGFKTPTLLGVWRSAPYFHDGSAATLADVIDRRHGNHRAVSSAERSQLVAYLKSLEQPANTGPAVAVSESALTVAEAGGTATYTMKLDTRPTGDVTITPTSDDTAVATVSGALTFTPDDYATAQTVTVTGVNDDLDNAADREATISHAVAGGGYDGVAVASVAVTATDDDSIGVTVSETALTVAEAAGTATYTVKLDAKPTGNVTVTPTSDDASVATASGALTFTTDNYSTPQTVTVTGIDDATHNAIDRATVISHEAAGGGYDGVAVASVAVTATDDDSVGVTVSKSAVTMSEAGGTATYTVKLEATPTGSVTVTPISDDESVATVSGALTFTTTNYATPQTVTVTGVDDDLDNATDRTTAIGHATSGGGYDGVVVAAVAVTATDDDDPGVALSALTLTVPESGSAAYTVKLMTKPTGDVLVAPFSTDGAVATVSPSFFAGTALTFTPANWNTPQTVTVSGVDDDVANASARTTTIGHWAVGGGYGALGALAIDDVAVTLADDEEPPTVSMPTPSQAVDEGDAATVTLTLSAPLGAAVAVPLSYAHLTSEPDDIESLAEIVIPAGQTSEVRDIRTRQDDDGDNELFVVWIDEAKLPAYLHRGADHRVHVMIVDDDGAPDQVAEVRVVHNGTSLTASWDAPARATVYDVTYYNHRTGENARAAWDRPGTSLTITCDVRPEHLGEYCVDGDSAYTVGVRAGNEAGKSAWVDSARVEPPASATAWLFPSAADPSRRGVLRVVNRSGAAGEVSVTATDDAGWTRAPMTLAVDAGATVEFDSRDLESGGAGLSGGTGPGTGDWRLALESATLNIEVLPYVRGTSGFASPMDATAPRDASGALGVALFNPGGETEARSLLRLVNPGGAEARALVSGVDDAGRSPGAPVLLTVPAGAACTVDAAQLETGTGLACGARQPGLGDGIGRWRLAVSSDAPLVAMNLLASPDGRLANLSRISAADADGVWHVPLFPSASSASGRQGLVRVVSRAQRPGAVSILATDDGGAAYPPVTLPLPAGAAVDVDADDLELGSRQKGLSGGTGAGSGAWRLALSGDVAFAALAYARGTDGFLTPMRTAAPGAGGRLAYLDPDAGVLRLANPGTTDALVTVAGTDDLGAPSASAVWVAVPAGTAVELTASALESGEAPAIVSGALGDGAGVWRLDIGSDTETVSAMSLLPGPMGSLADLSGPAPATKTEHAVSR